MRTAVTRFTGTNIAGLAVSGFVLLWLSRSGTVDFWLARRFFDPVIDQFPLKEAPLYAQLGHAGLKWLVVVIWSAAAAFALAALRVSALRAWRAPLALAVLSALAAVVGVASLKAGSPHSCPWNLTAFGGEAQWFALLDSAGANAGPGRCWPGGHASGGFALMAGYFALRDRHVAAARTVLAAALTLGAIMSFVQMARGAHFLSHNLWSLWVTWLVCLSCYLAFRRLVAPDTRPLALA